MIARERRLPRSIRRGLFAVAAIGLLYVVAGPLTSTDAAQQAGLPLLTDKLWFRIATTVAMFVVMASAWNIIGGFTGYASFGNIAFFGLGAYAVGVLVANQRWPFFLALLAAPLVAALFGLLVGLALLRLRGHYFAVATLGVGVAVGEVVNNVPALGASTGLFLPIVRSDLLFFYLMLGAALLAVGTSWLILHSRFGYGLLAIRENEEAAAVIGVNTTFYKVAALCIAAALTGLAGGIFAQWNVFISQELVFTISDNVQMILMAVLGGAGTVLGPVAGAIALELIIQTLAGGGSTSVFAQIGLGVLLTVCVIFIPRGVIDFFGGQSRLSLAYLRRTLRETSV
ncbi:MAG TPA: branched-chain amino acid ABC transporter permease [Candidatus Angelobacter sp.]|jgi:branched-chain amino acid transport system permease protein|nr:branched-chain amino acid ABC transporter permease [Candidatus Angelobacter sp.]